MFIFLLACNNYTLVILACKLCDLCGTNTILCIIIWLYFNIYFEVFQLEALMYYSIPSLLDIYIYILLLFYNYDEIIMSRENKKKITYA